MRVGLVVSLRSRPSLLWDPRDRLDVISELTDVRPSEKAPRIQRGASSGESCGASVEPLMSGSQKANRLLRDANALTRASRGAGGI